MKTSEFMDKLSDVLKLPPGRLKLDDTPETVAEWDSLGRLAMIGLVDSLFRLAFADKSLQDFRSIGELVESLKRQGFLEDDGQ